MTTSLLDTRPLPSRSAPRGTEPLSLLFEAPAEASTGVRGGLPAELRRAYGGDLTIPLRDDRPTVIANFVETIDGAVALDPDGRTGGGAVSGFSSTDRFVMGLLRAMADVVLVGAGTVRASAGTGWTPARAHPQAAGLYRDLRRRLGLAPEPATLIVTASGDLDPTHAAFRNADVPVVLAGPAGTAERLRAAGFPDDARIESLGDGDEVAPEALIDLARRMGARVVLSEGGPHVIAGLAAAGLLDELFLTLAPQLVGRDRDSRRLALLEGIALWPERASWGELLSVRRAGNHLFLRYRFPEDAS
ncbi:MAG: dihydrofolate reductase family protein [Candidatus Limnocylindrales bacterium]|nr:dihydrofolate reductase family protein [Candidatus Limnocylindrales bacterium]